MEPVLSRLRAGEVLVADGAMGTMLLARGLKAGECPERWNLDRPQVLEEIAAAYLAAGADIIETNTFGGSPLKLAQYALDDRTEEINERAARAVRAAVGDRAAVAGSCGPCGRVLLPYGDTDPEVVRAGFVRQMTALAGAGVDLPIIETMTDISEGKLALAAAREAAPELPVFATMTFDETPRGFFTVMGVAIPQAAEELAAAGADAVGANCGSGIEVMVRIAAEFREHTSLPVLIQSNAGLPKLVEGRAVYQESPDFVAGGCRKMLDMGVQIVGGCCGTTPEHIAAIRKVAD
jgi:5-methyltetrahydrofolate--homocysteine methyltransferase